jgi:hypothetical protein
VPNLPRKMQLLKYGSSLKGQTPKLSKPWTNLDKVEVILVEFSDEKYTFAIF